MLENFRLEKIFTLERWTSLEDSPSQEGVLRVVSPTPLDSIPLPSYVFQSNCLQSVLKDHELENLNYPVGIL